MQRISTQPTKVAARSAVPSARQQLIGLFVDGTWNVPTTLTFVGGVYIRTCAVAGIAAIWSAILTANYVLNRVD